MPSKLCPFCMRMTEGDTCHHCGKVTNYSGQPLHLPAGYVVSGTHPYVLGAALGQGGFGITYIALDMVTKERVAIKEYFPTYCSGRTGNHTVTAYQSQDDIYLKGRERFLDEAKTLKSLSDLKSIVNVLDFFEANNTAYLVMEYLDGSSLKECAAKNGKFPAQEFLEQIKPLMEDIQKMHDRGVIHRDIAPDNIILQPDGQMKLIDFGAARSYVGDKSMTVVVKKGFAPVEQYFSSGSSPSTDVYSLAATIYYCITGTVPFDSAQRQNEDLSLIAPSTLGADITVEQEQALLKALEVLQKTRTQSMQDFLITLELKDSGQESPKSENKESNERKISPGILAVTVIALILCCLSLYIQKDGSSTSHSNSENSPSSSQTQSTAIPIETISEALELSKFEENFFAFEETGDTQIDALQGVWLAEWVYNGKDISRHYIFIGNTYISGGITAYSSLDPETGTYSLTGSIIHFVPDDGSKTYDLEYIYNEETGIIDFWWPTGVPFKKGNDNDTLHNAMQGSWVAKWTYAEKNVRRYYVFHGDKYTTGGETTLGPLEPETGFWGVTDSFIYLISDDDFRRNDLDFKYLEETDTVELWWSTGIQFEKIS